MCPSLRCFIRRWRLRDRYRLLIRTHGPCTWSRCQIKEQGLSVWSLTKRTQECGSGCIPAHRKFTQPGRKRWTMMGGSTRKEDREKKQHTRRDFTATILSSFPWHPGRVWSWVWHNHEPSFCDWCFQPSHRNLWGRNRLQLSRIK